MDSNSLYKIIIDRIKSLSNESYTSSLSKQGIERVAQKVGEEAMELIVEALRIKRGKKRIIEESADLLFHYWVLLANSGITPEDVFSELDKRHTKMTKLK